MTEKDIQSSVMREVGSQPGIRLFRNPVSIAWVGKLISTATGGRVVLADAHRITVGLAPGSADLVGWRSIEITPEMVGQRVAVFSSVEIKKPGGRATPEQVNWRDRVIEAGGIAGIVRSVEEARELFSGQP